MVGNPKTMRPLHLTLLGGFQARLEGAPLVLPTRKSQALLAYLAVPAGQTHSRDKLAAMLWGDVADPAARASLRQAVFGLRKALGETEPPVLVLSGDSVTLDPGAVEVDAAAFERLLGTGTPAALEEAVRLYRGDLLSGFVVDEAAFEEWLVAERERLRELAVEALARRLAHQRNAGDAETAVQTALRLLTLDPLQEAVHRTLMRLYAELGRRAAALRQYQDCVEVLQRELGIEPEADTKRLYQELLAQRATRSTTARPDPGGVVAAGPVGATSARMVVGRDKELARLHERLGDSARDAGTLVALLGEAGIGKSTVVAALADDAVGDGARVLMGCSHEAEQILPFGPWVDALRTAGVLTEQHVIESLKPVWRAELTRLLPEAAAPGLPPASDDYLRLFESVAQLLEQLAAARPVLVVLEDVHWADEMTIRLLSFLTRRLLAQARVRLVVTARTEEVAEAGMLRRVLADLEQQRRLVRLTLGPLSPGETTLLVRRLARVGTGETEVERLGERVWTATEGNPFMVVETMRALDEGQEAGDRERLPMTDRVRGLIAGRLERLGERARQLVEVAAVVGRDFEFGLLQRAARIDAEEAASGLEELVRRRLLHGVGERFDFTHDRIRETAYARLLAPRRRLLHGDVACAMEELYGEYPAQHVAALGRHWFHAAVWTKAYPCLQRAGTAASAQSAHREAVAIFEQALQALAHLPRTATWVEQAIDIRFELHHALLAFGAPERTDTYLREAEGLARELGDRRRLARACAYLATNFRRLSDHDRAIQSARRALDLAESEGDFATQVVATSFLGHIYETMGEYGVALDVLTRNVAALPGALTHERFGGPGAPGLSSRCRLALSLAERGDFAEALTHGTEAITIAEQLGRPLEVCDACFAVAFVHLRQGDLQRAFTVLNEGRAFGERGDLPVELALLASERGYACALAGRLDEAIGLLEGASRDIESTGLRLRDALRVSWLGEAYLLAGRIDDAWRSATVSLDLARERKERGVEAWAARLLGEIAARRDDAPSAEAHYRDALRIADELCMRPLRAHCLLGIGRLHDGAAARDPARAAVAEAIEAFRSMGMSRWIPPANA